MISWLVLTASLLGSTVPLVPLGTQGQAKEIRVEVVNSSDRNSVSGARVFILSEEGKELASAVTNQLGIATLPNVTQAQRPKYVLVEHSAYFLSGMRWLRGLEEYYVLATILTVR